MPRLIITKQMQEEYPGIEDFLLAQFEKTTKLQTVGESVDGSRRFMVDGLGFAASYDNLDILVTDGVADESYHLFKELFNNKYKVYWR